MKIFIAPFVICRGQKKAHRGCGQGMKIKRGYLDQMSILNSII